VNDSDWISAERDHEFRLMREKNAEEQARREQITERVRNITIGVVVCFIVAIALGSITFVVERSMVRDHEQEMACLAAGGSWTSIGGGTTVCVRISEVQPR
jgi:hypothetical protein